MLDQGLIEEDYPLMFAVFQVNLEITLFKHGFVRAENFDELRANVPISRHLVRLHHHVERNLSSLQTDQVLRHSKYFAKLLALFELVSQL